MKPQTSEISPTSTIAGQNLPHPGANRRAFLKVSGAAVAALSSVAHLTGCASYSDSQGSQPAPKTASRPLVVSTWPFGKPANEKALATLEAGGSLLDAVVAGITVAELDLSNTSVGAGGTPNSEGVVSLDACIMDGPTHKCGSVAGVEGIVPVIGVARAVMEKTRHVLLVGDGARRFALQQGFQDTNLLTDAAHQAWLAWKQKQATAGSAPPQGHDTIALVILGADGNLVGGCSTSGLGYKLPGRVGDSPIIGSGLYVDNDIGAAGATGVGENIMRFCGSFQVVELMRAGASPGEACAETIRRIQKKHASGAPLDINFLAVDKQGRYGAAGTGGGFPYSVAYPGFSEVLPSIKVAPRM